MPTYEYRCGACGHDFERFHPMSDDPIRVCPSCEKPEVERLISTGGGIVFKGPGFYATDYRKDGPPKRESSDSGSEDGKGSGGETSGDKGPTSKPSSKSKDSES